MTEETVPRQRLRSLIHVVSAAVAGWRRERRLRGLLGEISHRGGDHLLEDIGMDMGDFREREAALREIERARRCLWML